MVDLLLHNYFMTYGDYNSWEWDWDHNMHCLDKDANGNPIPCGSGSNYIPHGQKYYPTANLHSWELDFPIHPYNDNPGNYLDPNQNPKMPHKMFSDDEDLKYHEQRVRYYLSRYGYSTAIYMWEQLDEIFHMSEDARTKTDQFYTIPSSPYYTEIHNAVNKYVRRMNKFIRENMGHKHQLLALNVAPLQIDSVSGYTHDESRFDPYGDCYTSSYYQIRPDELIGENSIGHHDDPDWNNIVTINEKTSFYQKVFAYQHAYYLKYGRFIPLMFAECGPEEKTFGDKSCLKGTDELLDNMRFGFIGAAGFNKWHYFTGNKYGVYESIIRAAGHMNGQDVKSVIGTSYQQGRQYEELKFGSLQNNKGAVLEMQYYLAADASTAVGYVHNRTVNYKTASGGDCHPGGYVIDNDMKENFNSITPFNWQNGGPLKRLKLKGLSSNSQYNIDFYGYPNGAYLSSYQINVGTDDKAIVRFPTLNQNRAVVWFVARKLAGRAAEMDSTEIVVQEELSDWVFPNPTSDVLHVSIDFGELMIYNAQGQKQIIATIETNREYQILDVSTYASGVYIVVSQKGFSPIKFVKL